MLSVVAELFAKLLKIFYFLLFENNLELRRQESETSRSTYFSPILNI